MIEYRYGKNSNWSQIFVILILSTAGIVFGMLFSWTSPGISELVGDTSWNITLEQASYFTIIPQISMILSAPLYSVLLNFLGRKKTAMLIGVPQFLSWLITGISNNIVTFYIARFLCGIGDAGVFTVIPLYIGEISEPYTRGSWGNTLIIFAATGKFLVILIGAYTTIKVTAIIGGAIAVVYIALASFVPESPYYLLMKNREDDARKSLSFLRWRHDVSDELTKLKSDVARQLSEAGTYRDLFSIKSNRRALKIAIGLRVAQQFTGLVAFESYAEYMFQQANGVISEKISAVLFSFASVPALCAFAFVSNKFGRRKLTLASCISCAIVLIVVSIYFGIEKFTDIPLTEFTWIPLVGLVAFMLACGAGFTCMPVLLLGELFSASVKAKATGVLSIVLAITTITVPKLFQELTYYFGIFAPFALFACCTSLSSIFCYMYLIETKGRTLEEIQQELKRKRRNDLSTKNQHASVIEIYRL